MTYQHGTQCRSSESACARTESVCVLTDTMEMVSVISLFRESKLHLLALRLRPVREF